VTLQTTKCRKFLLAAAGAGIFVSTGVSAQDFSLNSERLNSLEEPIATDIAGVTVEVTGVVDGRVDFDLDDEVDGTSEFEPALLGNFEITASTQLANRWNVGVAYFGQYEVGPDGGEYTDNVAGFIGTSWGTVLAGEVSGVVSEQTRRVRGIGNADLQFDGPLGETDNWGGGYVGQFGPARISGVADDDGNFDLGFVWQRPSGPAGYRFAARYTNAEYTAADGISQFDTQAVSGTFEYLYGQSTYNLGVGYEHFDGTAGNADRWFASAGWQRQFGDVTASAEVHYGEIDGQSEFSGALGLRYNLSRGLSLNLGLNHSDGNADVGLVPLLEQKETKATISLRFGF